MCDILARLRFTSPNLAGLNTRKFVNDNENSTLEVEFWWYNQTSGSELILDGNSSSLTAGSNAVITTLSNTYTAKGETWNCTVRTFDGTSYSTFNSSTITIQNSPPTTPVLIRPSDGNTTIHDRSPLFVWNSTDADNDLVNYTLNISFTSTMYCGADISTNASELNYTPTYDYCLDYVINWTVLAYDGSNYSSWSEVWNFTIE